jgi:hypothetical protein
MLDMGGEACSLLGTQIPLVKPAISCECKNASMERVCEWAPSRIKLSAHIWTDHNMEPQRNKVCGVDVHKGFLVATNLSRDGTKGSVPNCCNFSWPCICILKAVQGKTDIVQAQ